MPTTGAVSNPGSASSSYTHADESVSPGYYGVTLGNGVKTELTTTTRGGIGRFTFPSTTQANLLFKLTGSQNGDYATNWQVVSNTEVQGSVTSGHFCGAGNTYTVHFSVKFDQAFTTGTWLAGGVKAGEKRLAAKSTATTTPKRPSQHAAERAGKPTLHGASQGPGRAARRERRLPDVQHDDQPRRERPGRHLLHLGRQRQGEPRRRGAELRLRRHAYGGAQRVERRAGQDPDRRRHDRPAARLLHRALPRAAAPERVQRHERPVHGLRQRRAHGRVGPRAVRELLRLGHLPQPGPAHRHARARAGQ